MVQTIIDLCKVEPSRNTCVIFDDGESRILLTYEEFATLVQQLSLEFKRVVSDESSRRPVVGIYSDAHVFLPVLIYTMMKSATVFVPLSLATSSTLLATCLKDCCVKFLFIQKSLLKTFEASLGRTITIKRKFDLQTNRDYVLMELIIDNFVGDQEILYTVQSSGTTGQPKRILVPQACVLPNVVDLKKLFSLVHNDVIFISSALTFDASLVQMFLSWSAGAAMLISPSHVIRNPPVLSSILQSNKTSIIQCTPSLLALLGTELIQERLINSESSLRVLALGGERSISKEKLVEYTKYDQQLQVYNIYGTSELSAWASIHQVCASDIDGNDILQTNEVVIDWVPIGKPLTDTIIKICDKNGEDVGDHETGEIWIGSKQRICIVGDEHMSATDVVMRNTGDKGQIIQRQIYYCGRSNNLRKRNGKLISLDLLKQVADKAGSVQCSCCLLEQAQPARKELLMLFVVPSSPDEIDSCEREVLKLIQTHLADVYVPDFIRCVKCIPITNHGKVDRDALKCKEAFHADESNRLSLHDFLACSWCIALNSTVKPSLKDNFVQYGGNSFSAAFLINKISDYLNGFGQRSVSHEQLLNLVLADTFQSVLEFCEQIIDRERTEKFDNTLENSFQTSDLVPSESSPSLHTHFKVIFKQDRTLSCHCVGKATTCCANISVPLNALSLKLREKWTFDLRKCIDASPLVVVTEDAPSGVVYIGSHSHIFAAISLPAGVKVWETELPDRIESSAMISSDGNFVCVGCYDGFVYILDRKTGNIHWKYQTLDAVKSSPCCSIKHGIIVVGSHDQHVHALSIISKRCLWKVNFQSSCYSSPMIGNSEDVVFVCLLSGKIVALELLMGTFLWEVDLGKPIFSSPLLCTNFIVVGCVDKNLYAVDFSGTIKWKLETGAPIFSSPVSTYATEEIILFGSNDQHLYCVDSKGHLLWTYKTNAPIFASVATFQLSQNTSTKRSGEYNLKCAGEKRSYSGDIVNAKQERFLNDFWYVVVASTNGTISILNSTNGRCLLSYDLPGKVFSSPVVAGKNILVGCRNNLLYNLSLEE